MVSNRPGWPGIGHPLGQRNVIVLSHALQNEENGGRIAAVRDEVRPPRAHGIRLAGGERNLFLRIAQEKAEATLQDVERVLHMVVVMPRHLLRGADLQLRDTEARSLGMAR